MHDEGSSDGIQAWASRLGLGSAVALELLSCIGEGGDAEVEGLEKMFNEARSVAEGLEIDWTNPLAQSMGTAGGTRPKVDCERFPDGTFRAGRSPAEAGESTACVVKFDCTGEFAGRIDHETKIEASDLEMARDCGLQVPEFELLSCEGRDRLVLERFDKTRNQVPDRIASRAVEGIYRKRNEL